VAISGNPGFVPLGRENPAVAAAPVTVAFFEFDPFDAAASALHNQRLRELGYCLVLEGFTFDRRRMSAQQYCSAPRHESGAFDEAYATYRAGPPPQVSGIAYRPRIQYPLLVYRNDNAPGRGTWRLERQYSLGFENIAPIVSIGLTRSLFAARRVALKFNMGALEAMCLVKTSELQGAVMVPYEIVRSIIALPTAVFEVKIGNIGDNIDLLGAEAKVVRAQMEYLDFLADQTKDAVKSPLPKKEEVPLPGIPDPTARPAKIAIVDSVSARLSELDSGVLKQICSDAPSVLTLAPRKPGGMP
jgi:hypothetical protein